MAFDPLLGQLFQFDDEEVAANREGRLSQGQKLLFANTAKITKRQLKRSRTIMPMILIAVIVLVIFAQSRARSSSARRRAASARGTRSSAASP